MTQKVIKYWNIFTTTSSLLQMQSTFFIEIKLTALLETKKMLNGFSLVPSDWWISTTATYSSTRARGGEILSFSLKCYIGLFCLAVKQLHKRLSIEGFCLVSEWLDIYLLLTLHECVLFWIDISHVPLSELLIKGRYGQRYPAVIIFYRY